MIVIGDIACPSIELNKNLAAVFTDATCFKGKNLICNLEGLICDLPNENSNDPILYNHSVVIHTMAANGVKAVSLANNHTLDLPRQFDVTQELLIHNNIAFNGAGKTPAQAAKSVSFDDSGQEIIMISACWDFLLYHQRNPLEGLHVYTIDEKELLDRVIAIRTKNKSVKLLLFLHWSFDLETLPFPMYRQWSRALIDAGADFIIGCHSHCIQGGEKYKDGYIVYGLGNFYLPNGVFANGNLHFPDFAKMQMAFEFDFQNNEALCHWFQYNDDKTVTHLSSEKFEDSRNLKTYSSYSGMSDEVYLDYFKNNRRKKKLIPIFKDYNATTTNFLFTSILKVRAALARFLAKRKIIKWQN
jgi:Bacterial capsule synthesis protein PGA_cap